MNYQILGDSDYPMLHVNLKNQEAIKVERGAMAYLSNVALEGKMNSNKSGISGMLGALGRSMTSGESFFVTIATGMSDDSFIGIAPSIPGKIQCLQVGPNRQYRLNTGAFLACDPSVEYVMKKQSLSQAFLGGTGGFFVMETQGTGDIFVSAFGDIFVSAFGDILAINVTPEKPITVDNEHVVAWDASLKYSIHVGSGEFGFKTGEGIVNEFHGHGTVLIQTRNIHNLADAIHLF